MNEDKATIGVCSICMGPMQIDAEWSGPIPPTPECANCGARGVRPYLFVIPAVPFVGP